MVAVGVVEGWQGARCPTLARTNPLRHVLGDFVTLQVGPFLLHHSHACPTRGRIDMEALDYIEEQGRAHAAYSVETFEQMNKRCYALLTMVLGFASAVGSYLLANAGQVNARWVVFSLGAASLWWYAIAGWLLIAGLRTVPILPPGNTPQRLLGHLHGELTTWAQGIQTSGKPAPDLVNALREGQLEHMSQSIVEHQAASLTKGRVLDRAYSALAVSPGAAILGGLVAWATK